MSSGPVGKPPTVSREPGRVAAGTDDDRTGSTRVGDERRPASEDRRTAGEGRLSPSRLGATAADDKSDRHKTGKTPSPAPSDSILRRVGRMLQGALVHNAALKFVALVLAITLFVLVNNNRDAVISVNVGVSYTLPEDKVVVSELVDQLRLTIKGSWRRIKRFDERELDRINVNLQGWQGSEYTFVEESIRLPPGLTLLSITPASIPVRFEPREEKTVPVSVPTSGRPTYGYKVARITPKPSRVTVRGAKSMVDAVESVSTRELNLTGKSMAFKEILPLVVPRLPPLLEIADTQLIEVETAIVEEMSSKPIEDVPVDIRPGPGFSGAIGRFRIEPETVDLVLHGPLLSVESMDGGITAYIEVLDEDSTGKPREVKVQIEAPPPGVGLEIEPPTVTLRVR